MVNETRLSGKQQMITEGMEGVGPLITRKKREKMHLACFDERHPKARNIPVRA